MKLKYLPLLLIPANLFGLLHPPHPTTSPDSTDIVDMGGCYANAETATLTLPDASVSSDGFAAETPLITGDLSGQGVAFACRKGASAILNASVYQQNDNDMLLDTVQAAANTLPALKGQSSTESERSK